MAQQKQSYNRDLFNKFCKEQNITLLKDYSKEKINSKMIVEANCNYIDCSETVKKPFRTMCLYSIYCEGCTIKNTKEKTKKTCLEKYGVENPFQSEEKKKKIKETCLQKYGVENPIKLQTTKEEYKKTCLEKYGCENAFQNEDIKNKIKETSLKRYGVEVALQNPEIHNKMKKTNLERYGHENTFQVEKFKDKSKETLLERYGVENPMQSEEIRELFINTMQERYGVDHPSQCEEVKQKKKQTCLKNHGVEYSLQSKEVREKGIETNLRKYGCRNAMQNAEIAEKSSHNAYANKPYVFPSGNQILIQGYENFALDDLIYKENIDESDIITNRKEVPELWYDDEEGNSHRHFVDIFVKSQNRCIEVKSTWTMEKNRDKVLQKQLAGKAMGYIYEIWIYDNGIRIESL